LSLPDRQLWDNRYREGAYAERLWASAYFQQCMPEITAQQAGTRALDVACGRGRNSIYAAQQGYVVDAVDVSPMALAHAAQQALRTGVTVNWCCQNVQDSEGVSAWRPPREYDLIVMFRFVAPSLLPALVRHLAVGGQLLVEEHMQWSGPESLSGPSNPSFRVAPSALRQALLKNAEFLEIIEEFEGIVEEPDGSQAALSRIWVQRQK